ALVEFPRRKGAVAGEARSTVLVDDLHTLPPHYIIIVDICLDAVARKAGAIDPHAPCPYCPGGALELVPCLGRLGDSGFPEQVLVVIERARRCGEGQPLNLAV